MLLSGQMYIKCPEGDPQKYVDAWFGNHKLELVWVDKGLQTRENWCKVQFKPFEIKPGKYDFRFTVKNPSGIFTGKERVFNFDDLRLLLKDIKR